MTSSKTFVIGDLLVTTNGKGSGSLEGTLKEKCPECNSFICKEFCSDPFTDYNIAMDGIESLLLSMACRGIDSNDKEIQQAMQDTLQAVANNL